MKFLGQGFQKLEHEQDRQTDRHTHTDRQTDVTERITVLHPRVVTIHTETVPTNTVQIRDKHRKVYFGIISCKCS